jgi:hypothetical protein
VSTVVSHGDHVRWSGSMAGTVIAGPHTSADGRKFWWVKVPDQDIPCTVADVHILEVTPRLPALIWAEE